MKLIFPFSHLVPLGVSILGAHFPFVQNCHLLGELHKMYAPELPEMLGVERAATDRFDTAEELVLLLVVPFVEVVLAVAGVVDVEVVLAGEVVALVEVVDRMVVEVALIEVVDLIVVEVAGLGVEVVDGRVVVVTVCGGAAPGGSETRPLLIPDLIALKIAGD